jgi:hypothetical protein
MVDRKVRTGHRVYHHWTWTQCQTLIYKLKQFDSKPYLTYGIGFGFERQKAIDTWPAYTIVGDTADHVIGEVVDVCWTPILDRRISLSPDLAKISDTHQQQRSIDI